MFPTVVVDNSGTELAYIDSGPPPSGGAYTTVFAVHGVVFTSPVFRKVLEICHSKGVRFVAINRRGYPGSTPFSDADKAVVVTGTDAEKADSTFVDVFIQREKLPQISADGKNGGIAFLGWSIGTIFTAAAIAHVAALPSPVQVRLASHLRVHIMQEPPFLIFGLPMPPGTYTPELNTDIPLKARISSFTLWVTSYFQHGDLSTRDTGVLEYVLPATFRTPSIWNMSQSEITDIVDEGSYAVTDGPFGLNCVPQNHAVYEMATFDKGVRDRLPHLKIWLLAGDSTVSFCQAAFWSIQDDDKAHGGNNINYQMIPRLNHFMHWDEPEKTVEAYIEALR